LYFYYYYVVYCTYVINIINIPCRCFWVLRRVGVGVPGTRQGGNDEETSDEEWWNQPTREETGRFDEECPPGGDFLLVRSPMRRDRAVDDEGGWFHNERGS
jgi:hypothetical protein